MVRARELTMCYGTLRAVEGVSLEVALGEILGLLGPNGAGKTTILRILSTQIVPTRGEVYLNGEDAKAHPEKVRAFFGYLPETPPLYLDMEVREYLHFVGEARGLSGRRLQERTSWVVEACGLSGVWRQPLGELSKGYRQRVGLAQALIHDPPILILDEPTTGLDPLQIKEMRSLIRELSREKAVIFSSHILQEVEALADRVLILNQGKEVASGTREEIYRRVFPRPVFRVEVEGAAPDWGSIPGVLESERVGEESYRVVFQGEDLFRTLCEKGVAVRALYPERLSLEELFLRLVGGGA
ncbi:ATP-binding cassette domain-containing protein [Thermosulfurimonas marina]|uniref:ATP-binding cassette domain-containing protein n=1 Tax=Thermosulfurimonas marina TaxID=2047767 RepID=A0A6H1WV28_9BACT|nr:ATP-binding cassette domain-containing protein [Thermosulfurimonas marina]